MEENNNMNEIQVQEVLDKLKQQLGELTYQILYRDIVIEALQKQIEELQKNSVEVMEPREN
jgi:hypothetical protein